MEEMICNGNFYHVCTDGLEQVTLLKDEDDFKTAWNYLALSAWRNGVSVVAFTLMSNHVHELLACKKAGQADKTIKLYKKLISTFLRRKYGLSQTLHRTRDCISVIDSIQYLKNCIAYILRNAVCARICSKPEDYRWSSYECYFSDKRKKSVSIPVSELTYTEKRRLLKTGMDLSNCPLRIDEDGLITLESFVESDVVEKAYKYSGKSFLYYLGCCNDAKMEYELACQPMMHVSDQDMYETIRKHVANRFRGKELSELSSSEKCSILKSIFFNNKTSIPQLSRIMGLSRKLIQRILST